ncbi:MAG: copper resistance protein CopC [Proteobacteria bacterium]|nr:copper resistance protein CopC [Pseudomonadota bacterium]
MTMRSAVWLLLPILCMFVLQPVAPGRAAEPLKVIDTGPVDHAVIDGPINMFYVRFNQPVDHIRSVLMIEHAGRVISTLQPRFDSAPEVLYAASPTLLPGDYRLRWSVRTITDKDIFDGAISFTVKAKR